MGMVVRTNTMAVNAYRQLGLNNSAVAKSLEKLASGYRINRAGDDAAGLAISEKMKAQITGLETASANAQDGISLIQTAEGNLNEVHDMLNRMVELATKSANGTYTQQERSALQDEVNQLLDEIDRISKSANFNGAKLLDGTMGLNQEAFTKFTDQAAVTASDGTLNAADFVAKEADGSPKVHLETEAIPGQDPSATIDLGDLTIEVKNGDTATLKLSIGGNTYDVSLAAGGADKTFDKTSTDLADAVLEAIQGSAEGVNAADGTHDTTTTNNDAIRLGDHVYSIATAAGKLNLTYAGSFDGTTYTAKSATAGSFSENQAKSLNESLGFDVEVKGLTDGEQTAGTDVIHKATNVEHAKVDVKATKAGIDINLADLVKDGNTLTIDGTTFIFKVGKDSEIEDAGVAGGGAATGLDADGNTIIDVSTAKEGDEVHMAADLLSKKTITGKSVPTAGGAASANSRTWTIGVNGDGTTIHIDQTAATANTHQALNTYDDLLDIISAKGAAVKAANASTKIDADASKLVAGDAINIGGKTYTFGDGEGQVALGENGADALNNLASALEKDGYTAEVATNGKSITVQAKDAKATSGPAVIGPGLTLQIGDTAEEFNKMNVSVANMSSKALGLGNLKITSEALASDAIDKVKNAINSVSSTRATMGALQNRLEHTINNLDVAAENLSAANSRIRDTDMAKEMMNYTKMNVLVQSAQAMLAQANQQPQSVLQLLQ